MKTSILGIQHLSTKTKTKQTKQNKHKASCSLVLILTTTQRFRKKKIFVCPQITNQTIYRKKTQGLKIASPIVLRSLPSTQMGMLSTRYRVLLSVCVSGLIKGTKGSSQHQLLLKPNNGSILNLIRFYTVPCCSLVAVFLPHQLKF